MVLTVQRATGSSATAGLALAVELAGAGALAPLRGRLVDRFGTRRALVPMALASGAGFAALAAAAEAGAGAAVLVALAGAAGCTVPPLIASARVVWPRVIVESDLPAAYGLQALLGDAGSVAGPAVTGAAAALASPSLALVAVGVLPAAGALLLAPLPWPPPAPRRSRAGALAAPGMRTLVAAEIGAMVGFGALEVALPALAVRDGDAAAAAVPLTVFAVGSALASLRYGSRPAPAVRRFLLGSVALAVCFAPLALAGSVWAATPILLAAGVAFAAVNVAVYQLLDTVAPEGTGAEALTWLTTAGAGAAAVGALLAGRLAEAGPRGALLLPCAGAALAAVVVLMQAGTLRARA